MGLEDEVAALRAVVESLQAAIDARPRVTLRPSRTRPFLGQPVSIVATVTGGPGGRALSNVPVTLAATWGRLRAADGFRFEEGGAVTVPTGVDGQAEVTLMPPTPEDLLELQQQALETQLGLLDVTAETPGAAEAGLRNLARLYDRSVSLPFRRAVDAYIRDFRPDLLEPVSPRDPLGAWSYFDSLVIAYAHNDGAAEAPGGAIEGAALLHLRLRDWLGPWFQIYQRLSEQESALNDTLQNVKLRGAETGLLVEGVYEQLRRWAEGRQGLVGERVGRRVAETVLQTFADTGIADLPADVRSALFSAVNGVSSSLATGGPGVLAALGQTRSELREEVSVQITGETDRAIAGVRDRLQIEAAGIFEAARGDLGGLRAESLATHRTELGGARGEALTTFRGDVGRVRADTLAGFQNDVGGTRTQALQGFQTDVGAVRASTLGGFQQELTTIRSTTLTQFQTDIGKIRTDVTRDVRADLDRARTQTLQGFQSDIANLRSTTLTQFQTDIGKIRTDVTRDTRTDLDRARAASLETFQRDVGSVRGQSLEAHNADLARARGDSLNTFRTDADRIRRTSLDTHQVDLGNLGRDAVRDMQARLRTEVADTTVGRRLGQLEESITRVGNNVLSIRTQLTSRPG